MHLRSEVAIGRDFGGMAVDLEEVMHGAVKPPKVVNLVQAAVEDLV